MSSDRKAPTWKTLFTFRRTIRTEQALTIVLAGLVGVLAGIGAVVFSELIHWTTEFTVKSVDMRRDGTWFWSLALCAVPAVGLLLVSWLTRRFAPEAQGHGVPEVIFAVARQDGRIRPRVSIVKILASGLCIGTGGSVGREGPIVQIGSSLGSFFGQLTRLPIPNVKVLVGAGAAAGISATFNAPLSGVIFASEIILGNFGVESMTPVVIASVLANVVQKRIGEHRLSSAFQQVDYQYYGVWSQLPSYFLLGVLAGLAAVVFVKLLYATEDVVKRYVPNWAVRALVCGLLVGGTSLVYSGQTPVASDKDRQERQYVAPALFGVGYHTVDHALHLQYVHESRPPVPEAKSGEASRGILLNRDDLWHELLWLFPLAICKPLFTSITLAGGGSGGIFAPSLFIGATLGASFGLLGNMLLPEYCASPGVYAIVGMGAVVAGTTQGILSAILIVYELTNDYHIILPIMIAAGLASLIAQSIDSESIYHKKLSRRGQSIARSHDVHGLEHVKVRDVMIRHFPTVKHTDTLEQIVRVARLNPDIECLPVMNDQEKLVGIIRSEDLHRILDTDIAAHVVNAYDIAITAPIVVSPDENLLEALRDFGTRDVETLPVEEHEGKSRTMVGLLLRSDVMRRYRLEMLRR